jgi:hypothetical protein
MEMARRKYAVSRLAISVVPNVANRIAGTQLVGLQKIEISVRQWDADDLPIEQL